MTTTTNDPTPLSTEQVRTAKERRSSNGTGDLPHTGDDHKKTIADLQAQIARMAMEATEKESERLRVEAEKANASVPPPKGASEGVAEALRQIDARITASNEGVKAMGKVLQGDFKASMDTLSGKMDAITFEALLGSIPKDKREEAAKKLGELLNEGQFSWVKWTNEVRANKWVQGAETVAFYGSLAGGLYVGGRTIYGLVTGDAGAVVDALDDGAEMMS